MAYQDYVKAQKAAEKQYRHDTARGEYPYLPVLEDLLRGGEEEGRAPLGTMEIPLSLVAGTASSERTTAFASNFLPLLAYETEFGGKWSELYDSVSENGVQNPVTAFEYMQRFYIVEGNKRVSVSKFSGAVRIEANVTRILPKPSDSPEYILYEAFLKFYRVSGMYEIEMTTPEAFEKLTRLVSPELQEDETWDEDLRRDVRFLYLIFEERFLAKTGGALPITAGDAFARFLDIYGFEPLRALSSEEIKRCMNRVFTEFRVLADENPVERILDPTEGSKKVAFTKKLPFTGSTLKIAFILPKDPESSAWSYNHELGRRAVEDEFGDAVQTVCRVAPESDAEAAIEEAIEEGCKVIFTASPIYHAVSMRMAVAHPESVIMNCSLNTAYKQLRTYYLRIYEAKFITGAIAGSMTENARVGYIADYPILGTPASVNAFALGVKLVNPRAMVYLDWSSLADHDPAAALRERGIDILSDRDISAPRQSDDSEFGLYGLYGDVSFRLAAPVWNWGSLYAEMVHSVMIGAWKNDANENETQALNYYWGMSSGAIDVAVSDRLPAGTTRLVRILRERVTRGETQPFSGVLYNQNGERMAEADETLTPEQIIRVDWLLDNVIGEIPDISALREDCRDFVVEHGLVKPEEART